MNERLYGDNLQKRRERGIEITWAGMLNQLQSIKRMEMQWIILYSAITLPTIGYLFVRTKCAFPESDYSLLAVGVVYLFATTWMYKVIYDERQSYYMLLRCVRRAQNYFRLVDGDFQFFPSSMRSGPFPQRFGRNVKKDDTKRWYSYLHRMLYLAGLNLALTFAIFRQEKLSVLQLQQDDWRNWGYPFGVVFLVHIIVIWVFLWWDKKTMIKRLNEERDLVGANEDDYPPRDTK